MFTKTVRGHFHSLLSVFIIVHEKQIFVLNNYYSFLCLLKVKIRFYFVLYGNIPTIKDRNDPDWRSVLSRVSIVVRRQLSWRRFCWRASSAAVMISSSTRFRPLILGLNAGLLFQKVLKELRIKWTTAGVFEARQEILYWEHFDAEK